MARASHPVAGKTFTDANGRKLVVDSVDHVNIVLRVGKRNVLIISHRSWNSMGLTEVRRTG